MSVDYGNPEALKTWLSARPTRNPVLEVMRDTFDSGDAYGSCLAWHFAVADALHVLEASQLPVEWEFIPAMFDPDTEAYEYAAVLEAVKEGATLADLVHAGNVLPATRHSLSWPVWTTEHGKASGTAQRANVPELIRHRRQLRRAHTVLSAVLAVRLAHHSSGVSYLCQQENTPKAAHERVGTQ